MSKAADLPGAAVVDAARKPAHQFQRLLHPLCGADLTTLLGVLVDSGGIAPQHLPRAGIALTAAIARWPFSTVEGVVTAGRRRQSGPMPAPLFIVGHWRSGTTHLYNVLTRSPAFGYVPPIATGLPWDMLGLGRVLRPLLERALPRERFVDSLPVRPDSPQEDEIALANMQPLSFYHGSISHAGSRNASDRASSSTAAGSRRSRAGGGGTCCSWRSSPCSSRAAGC